MEDVMRTREFGICGRVLLRKFKHRLIAAENSFVLISIQHDIARDSALATAWKAWNSFFSGKAQIERMCGKGRCRMPRNVALSSVTLRICES